MSKASGRPAQWLKIGCIGVIAVTGMLAVWAGSLFATAFIRARNQSIESREFAREVRSPGHVQLDFAVGEFYVVRGEPGTAVHVEAEFDRRSYALEERYVPAVGGGWQYRVTFKEITWFQDGGLRALVGGSFPRIVVSLPPDVPLALSGRFGKGYARLELGGLWLTEVDLDFSRGLMVVEVDRPLVEPMERMTIRSRQAGMFARSLGNASPRTLEIDHTIGGLELDLSGAWARDAEVRIASRFSEAELTLPDGVAVEGLSFDRTKLTVAPAGEVPRPTLRFEVSTLFGGIETVVPDR